MASTSAGISGSLMPRAGVPGGALGLGGRLLGMAPGPPGATEDGVRPASAPPDSPFQPIRPSALQPSNELERLARNSSEQVSSFEPRKSMKHLQVSGGRKAGRSRIAL